MHQRHRQLIRIFGLQYITIRCKKSWNLIFAGTKIGALFLSNPESRSLAWFFYRLNSFTLSFNVTWFIKRCFPRIRQHIFWIAFHLCLIPKVLWKGLSCRGNFSLCVTGLKTIAWFGYWMSAHNSQWNTSSSRNCGLSIAFLQIHGRQ
jgi:hypothetical protein